MSTPSIVEKIVAAVRISRDIMRERTYGSSSAGIVAAYWRLKIAAGVFGRQQPRERVTRIAGHSITYFDLRTLAFLFGEVFFKREYAFRASTSAPVIIDCGANIGLSICFFKLLYPASRITAFEPGDEAFAALSATVARNGWSADVAVHHAAVAEQPGTITFYYDPADPGSPLMSTVASRMPKASRTVDAVTLSSVIGEPIDFLKLDIEGAETGVIADLARSGRLAQVHAMAIEYHHHVSANDDALSRMLSVLEENGFGYSIVNDPFQPPSAGSYQDLLLRVYRRSASGLVPAAQP